MEPNASRQAVSGTLRRLISAFRRDVRAAAALEFVFVVPIILTLYIGAVEVANLIGIDRKMVALSRTLTDLATQRSTPLTNADITDIFAASSAIIGPQLDPAFLKVRLTSVAFSGTGTEVSTFGNNVASVCWSAIPAAGSAIGTKVGTKWAERPRGQVLDPEVIAVGLRQPGRSVVLAEVEYETKPLTGWFDWGTLKLSNALAFVPRSGKFVERAPGTSSKDRGVPEKTGGPC